MTWRPELKMLAVREKCWQITTDRKWISDGKKILENCAMCKHRSWNKPGEHSLWRGIPQVNEEKQISEFLWENVKISVQSLTSMNVGMGNNVK